MPFSGGASETRGGGHSGYKIAFAPGSSHTRGTRTVRNPKIATPLREKNTIEPAVGLHLEDGEPETIH